MLFRSSVAIILNPQKLLGLGNSSASAVVAAALAVIAAAYSAFSAQQTIEMQEDALKPYPYPFFDLTSRPGIPLFRVKNFGGTVAHDIEIIWDKDKPFEFSRNKNEPDIAVLMPGQTISYNKDTGSSSENPRSIFTGAIKFKDASGRSMKHKFVVSAGQYYDAYTVDDESKVSQFTLQNISGTLTNIEGNINRLGSLLDQYLKNK